MKTAMKTFTGFITELNDNTARGTIISLLRLADRPGTAGEGQNEPV